MTRTFHWEREIDCETLPDVKSIHRKYKIPSVFLSHDSCLVLSISLIVKENILCFHCSWIQWLRIDIGHSSMGCTWIRSDVSPLQSDGDLGLRSNSQAQGVCFPFRILYRKRQIQVNFMCEANNREFFKGINTPETLFLLHFRPVLKTGP